MARQLVLLIASIVLLTCLSVSWGQTCNLTSHVTSRTQINHETTMLDGWIDVANGFVHAVAPKNLDALGELAELVRGNKVNSKDVILEVFKMEAAFAACLFLGLIYFLTMGTGWSCFLCCRCCGNCGANKTQRQTKNIDNRRCIYVVLTIAVLGFLVAAVTSAFMANEEMYWVVHKGNGSIQNVIDKVELYINSTHQEIKTLNNCFEKTRENVISRVEEKEIEDKLAKPLKKEIEDDSATIIASLKKLNAEFKDIKGLKEKVEFVQTNEARVGELETKITALKSTCSGTTSDTECTEIKKLSPDEFKEVKGNSFNSIPTNVGAVLNFNFLQTFQDQLDQIPQKIVKETKQTREDTIKEIKSFTKDEDIITEIEKYVNDFHNEANVIKDKLNDFYSKYIKEQEVYRYWGVFGLIMFVALPSGLLFLGLCCGLLGSKSGRYPSERSGLSHCAGCTMMASVYLMFILGSVTMLFTVAFFQVGGHVEAYGCRYLYEEDLSTVDRVVNMMLPNKSDSKIFEDLKSLKIGKIVNKCGNDSTIYEAVPNLEKLLHANLTFDKELDKIDFSGYEGKLIAMIEESLLHLSNELKKAMNEFAKVDALHGLLGFADVEIIKADISKTVADLEKLNITSNIDRDKLLKEVLVILRDLKNASQKRKEITTTLGSRGENIDEFNKLMKKTLTEIENTLIGKIIPKTGATIKKMVEEYCKDILKEIKDFAKEATDSVKTKVGRCRTLYDAFSLGRHFACREILGRLNALWFSLGMCCFFFLFAIPFATKLSKHFYIMDEDEDSYIGMDSLHGQHISGYAEQQVVLYKGGNNYAKGPPRPTHHQNGAYEPDIEDRWTRY